MGAMGGSAISIAYLLPRGRRDAAIRIAGGVMCGVIFGPWVAARIASWGFFTDDRIENILAGCAFASAFSWSAFGAINRFLLRVDAEKTGYPFDKKGAKK